MFSTCTYKTINNSGKDFMIGSDLHPSVLSNLNQFFSSFKSILVNEFDLITCTNAGKCFIKTKNTKPIVCQSNKLTRRQNDMLTEKMSELLRLGVIQHSNSEWSSNAYAKELDNGEGLSLYVNYSKLNETIEDIDFTIPYLEDNLRLIPKSRVFSKIIIKDGFYQIPMSVKDMKRTAFLTELGKFEFNVMPYNLKNADKIFYKILRKVVGDDSMVQIHSDQILILSDDFDIHFEKLKKLFKNLKDSNFKVDVKKSCFCVDRVEFGGHEISNKGFTVGPDYLEKIRSFPTPKSSAELMSFFKLTDTLKRYVQNYEIILNPLLELSLSEKKENFNWNLETKTAFYKLIISLMNAPHLAFFKDGQLIRIETEFFSEGFSVTLQQKDSKDKWQPISFYSKTHQGNFSVSEAEKYAISYIIPEFEYTYLQGQNFKIVHKSNGKEILNNKSPIFTDREMISIEIYKISMRKLAERFKSNYFNQI